MVLSAAVASSSDTPFSVEEALRLIEAASSLVELEDLRVHYLGKQGVLSLLLKELGKIDAEERKARGAALNVQKESLQAAFSARKLVLDEAVLAAKLAAEKLDISLVKQEAALGKLHMVSMVQEELISYFSQLGFQLATGPDIETDFYNFTALNIPESHPARQMHDTFYLRDDAALGVRVLRTHTSCVQIRAMQQHGAPLRVISTGRTYRSDSDQTHTPMFHQLEGLYIDKAVHMGHLKAVVVGFLQHFFGLSEVPIRFRPSFFPFTEPSAEVDIGCKRGKERVEIGQGSDWLEILGCGMVHPEVLKAAGIDAELYQGFAFGVGVERLAMLKYGAPDLRAFFDQDSRWLSHFGFLPSQLVGSAGVA
jgi:phenylalanyl-tRNA synthetase alpha chain